MNITSMFANFASAAQALIVTTQGVAYVMAIYFAGLAAFRMIDVAKGQKKLSNPIMLFFVSGMAAAFPSMISIVAATSTGAETGNMFGIPPTSASDQAVADALHSLMIFVQFIGNIAFLRGILLLKAAGEGKDQVLGRATVFLIAGAMCVNIDKTVAMFASTLAPGMPMPF